MQVLCKSTIGHGETQCSVCGQGFVMFWERHSRAERSAALCEIQKELVGHHYNVAGKQAHPHAGFMVPKWDVPMSFSGAPVQGHASPWGL